MQAQPLQRPSVHIQIPKRVSGVDSIVPYCIVQSALLSRLNGHTNQANRKDAAHLKPCKTQPDLSIGHDRRMTAIDLFILNVIYSEAHCITMLVFSFFNPLRSVVVQTIH